MSMNDEWSGLADLLAGVIEKSACEMNLDSLPDPDKYYKTKRIKEQYKRFMELRRQMRNQMREAAT